MVCWKIILVWHSLTISDNLLLMLFFKLTCVCVRAKSLNLCLNLFDPMDGSPPGSSIHGIL